MTLQIHTADPIILKMPTPVDRESAYFKLTAENVLHILNSEHMTRTEQAEQIAEMVMLMVRAGKEL